MSVLLISWVLTFLTVFALTFGHETRVGLKRARLQLESVVCRGVARSGVEIAREMLRATSQNEWDSPLEGWDENPLLRQVPLGAAYFSVGHRSARMDNLDSTYGIEDEDRKIPLWEVDRHMLQRLHNLEEDDAKAVLDFVNSGGHRELARLESIPGLSDRGRETVRQYFTLYATSVNINTASAEVLRVLGIPEHALTRLLNRRDGPDAKCGTPDDQPFSSVLVPAGGLAECNLAGDEAAIVSYLARRRLLTVRSSHYHVRSRGWVGDRPTYYEVDAVFRRSPNGEMAVVQWSESWNP